jgi:catechol 2,3-dioxygenase-like lactoylglutathione lyase family enzyme
MAVQLDLVGIVVEDMARSLAFYRQLGLDLPPELDGQPHAEARLGSGLRLAWDTQKSLEEVIPDYRPPAAGGGRVVLAFLADSADEVDALYGRLTALGYAGEHAPWDAAWGQRYAIVQDPDGNGIELFASLP